MPVDTTSTDSSQSPTLLTGLETWAKSAWNWIEGAGSTVASTVANDAQAIASIPGTAANAVNTGINAITIIPIVVAVVGIIIVWRLLSPKNIKTTASAAKALI